MIDASFEKIENIRRHPDADKLDLAEVGGFTVVIGRDQFKDGDIVFYIREDAQLMRDNARWPWQEGAAKFASSSGRIKVVKLRGVYSAGLAMPVDAVYAHIRNEAAKGWQADNTKLKSSNAEEAAAFLLAKFGIKHYELPCPVDGDAVGGLPWGIHKSDEENFQSVKDEIPWGDKCLVTKKLDGSSMAVCCSPDGEVHICSRSMEKKQGVDNAFNRAAAGVIEVGLAWAKHYGKRIVFRGELTAHEIQRFSFNHDREICGGKPTFNIYGVNMPDEPDFHDRFGRYGSQYHFLKVIEQAAQLTGIELKHVPILETDVELTPELFTKYTLMPKSWGEGAVMNYWNGNGSCKAKSLEYLGKLSEVL